MTIKTREVLKKEEYVECDFCHKEIEDFDNSCMFCCVCERNFCCNEKCPGGLPEEYDDGTICQDCTNKGYEIHEYRDGSSAIFKNGKYNKEASNNGNW